MLGPSEFRELVSGRRRGLGATIARGLLRIAEVPYTLVVDVRNGRYDRDPAKIHRVDVPVISIGNLTLGGTGKTPMVKWMARRLSEMGMRSAIVSRGYGAAGGEQNDEAMELADALPQVPHVQNRDRVAGAKLAIQNFHPHVLLLDDGFQHRRLARDLDIVLLDALEPFGFEHVFPRGTLREPISGLRRANVICLSRADAVTEPERKAIQNRAGEVAPQAAWCELAHMASRLVNSRGESQPLDSIAGCRVTAFCGIGNPAGFRHTLASTGCDVVAWREFPDHYAFTPHDLQSVREMALNAKSESIVCTQKDLVKVRQPQLGDIPLWALSIEIQFLCGQDAVASTVEKVVRQHRDNER